MFHISVSYFGCVAALRINPSQDLDSLEEKKIKLCTHSTNAHTHTYLCINICNILKLISIPTVVEFLIFLPQNSCFYLNRNTVSENKCLYSHVEFR